MSPPLLFTFIDPFLTIFPPDRNTTLPHPDADTSKNACLESADVPLSRTSSRLSFRGHRTKSSQHKLSRNASLVHDPAEMYKGIEYVDGGKVKADDLPRDSGVDIGRPASATAKKDDAASVSSSEEDGEGGRRKKRGLRERLHLK